MSLIAKAINIPEDTGKILANNVELTKVISVHNNISNVVWEKQTKREYVLVEPTVKQNIIYNVDASLYDDEPGYNGIRSGYTDFGELIECNGQYLYIDATRYADIYFSTFMHLYLKDESGNRIFLAKLFTERGYDSEHSWDQDDLSSPKQIQLPSSGKYYISLHVKVAGYFSGWTWVGWTINEMKIIKEMI